MDMEYYKEEYERCENRLKFLVSQISKRKNKGMPINDIMEEHVKLVSRMGILKGALRNPSNEIWSVYDELLYQHDRNVDREGEFDWQEDELVRSFYSY